MEYDKDLLKSIIIDKIKENRYEKDLINNFIKFLKDCIQMDQKSEKTQSIESLIKKIQKTLKEQCPFAFPIFNILLRMKTLLNNGNFHQEEETETKLNIILRNQKTQDQPTGPKKDLMKLIADLQKIETANEECCVLANNHINEGEVILFYANFDIVEEFIKITFEDNNYSLIIIPKEKQPLPNISEYSQNREIIFMSQTSIFSIMPKVNKVFMDCYSVMSDGAALSDAGALNISIVAKEFAVPLFLIAPRFKFTPLYAFSQDTFNILQKPQEYFAEAEGLKNLEILVNRFNLVPADQITIIITEKLEYSTNYVYRVFSEYYPDIDYGYHFDQLINLIQQCKRKITQIQY